MMRSAHGQLALATVDAFFRAIESVDAFRIARLFADDATLEDPVGNEVVRGRANIEATFATGFATVVQRATIRTIFAAESGGRVAAHWTMLARTTDDRSVRAEGIDVIAVNADGFIERVEGYWDAAAFAAALAG